ncbi:MAG: hypothetical protein WDO56_15870 [Gammaproteobacteria bacterium]
MSAAKRRVRAATLRAARKKKSSASPTIPVDQAELLLQSLKGLFNDLDKVSDVLIVCGKALNTCLENEKEIANVLQRGGSDLLFSVSLRLSKLIEGLGGETSLTGEDGDDE